YRRDTEERGSGLSDLLPRALRLCGAAVPLIGDLASSWPEHRGHPHQIRQGIGFHLSHHFASMRFHRDLAYSELTANMFVEQTGRDARHHFALAMAERRVAIPKRAQFRRLSQREPASLD